MADNGIYTEQEIAQIAEFASRRKTQLWSEWPKRADISPLDVRCVLHGLSIIDAELGIDSPFD